MIIDILAKYQCDICGAIFTVELDPAYVPPTIMCMFDIAEDAVRGSLEYRSQKPEDKPYLSCSVNKTKHLCGMCSYEADKE
jgi:hypothetical protein